MRNKLGTARCERASGVPIVFAPQGQGAFSAAAAAVGGYTELCAYLREHAGTEEVPAAATRVDALVEEVQKQSASVVSYIRATMPPPRICLYA